MWGGTSEGGNRGGGKQMTREKFTCDFFLCWGEKTTEKGREKKENDGGAILIENTKKSRGNRKSFRARFIFNHLSNYFGK